MSGEDDLLAAEYVLGALPAGERAALERRAARDAGFARRIAGWEERLAPLADGIGPVPPPARIRAEIERRLFGTPSRRTWDSLALWRGLAGLTLAALIVLVVLLPRAPGPAGAPGVVASLRAEGSGVHYLVVYDGTRLGLSHVSGSPGAGQDFELWLIAGGGTPVSLGVIPAGGQPQLTPPPAARGLIGAGAVLAISLEPAGGSPTGQPTGAVLALGDLHGI